LECQRILWQRETAAEIIEKKANADIAVIRNKQIMGNGGSESDAGHHRQHREEKTTLVQVQVQVQVQYRYRYRYGQVRRMPEERIPKLITEWIPRERRKRGRPRKT
jgi:hypothetical protein